MLKITSYLVFKKGKIDHASKTGTYKTGRLCRKSTRSWFCNKIWKELGERINILDEIDDVANPALYSYSVSDDKIAVVNKDTGEIEAKTDGTVVVTIKSNNDKNYEKKVEINVSKENEKDVNAFASGLKNIIKGVSDLGLKVMINGGSEFLDDMNDQNDNIFDSIWAYHQEEVFSLISDYQNNVFTTQNDEDNAYYQEIAAMMHTKGKEVFFLEYTTDENLRKTISDFCEQTFYHYYIANSVELK